MVAKIYKRTCTQGYMMGEQGESYSLSSWGNDTAYYHGYDDGGKDYILPEGYHLAETKYGEVCIFDPKNVHCEIIMHSSGLPQLVSISREMPVLRVA